MIPATGKLGREPSLPWNDEQEDLNDIVERIKGRANDQRDAVIDNARDIAILLKTSTLEDLSKLLNGHIPSDELSKYGKMGNNPGICDPVNRPALPRYSKTLHELSFLTPQQIAAGIENGRIHADMTSKEAKGLRDRNTIRTRRELEPIVGDFEVSLDVANESQANRKLFKKALAAGIIVGEPRDSYEYLEGDVVEKPRLIAAPMVDDEATAVG